MKRRIDRVVIAMVVVLLTGCGSSSKRPWGTLTDCEEKNTDLSMQVQSLQTQNEQLTEQVAALSRLDKNVRLDAINTLQSLHIGKHSGFFDKNEDGDFETLVVYLKPLDTAQDTVKAPGQATVELWNLNGPENDAKLAEWTILPEQLHTAWGGTIFHSYYRIVLPLEITLQPQTEYTLKVTFTDYVGGKVLTEQTVITP